MYLPRDWHGRLRFAACNLELGVLALLHTIHSKPRDLAVRIERFHEERSLSVWRQQELRLWCSFAFFELYVSLDLQVTSAAVFFFFQLKNFDMDSLRERSRSPVNSKLWRWCWKTLDSGKSWYWEWFPVTYSWIYQKGGNLQLWKSVINCCNYEL